MIAVSSFRPLRFTEYAENQIRARMSWTGVFPWVIYFGEMEKKLNYAKPGEGGTVFIPIAGKPTIKQMAREVFYKLVQSGQKWGCLINADIIVSKKFLKVEEQLNDAGAMCALSKRYELRPDGDIAKCKVDGNALDFFCGTKDVWEQAYEEIPDVFKIGHQLWDTWMASFFATNWPNDSYDLTPSRLMFHPPHESRGNQETPKPVGDPYLDNTRYPVHIIEL